MRVYESGSKLVPGAVATKVLVCKICHVSRTLAQAIRVWARVGAVGAGLHHLDGLAVQRVFAL